MADLDAFLNRTPWAGWTQTPMVADASARRYVRLADGSGATVVAMDSGPVPTEPFVRVAAYLCGLGLSAPQVLRHDPPFVIMTDLGPTDLATALEGAAPAGPTLATVVDVLAQLHHAPQPDLAHPSVDDLGDAVRLTSQYHAPNADPDQLAALTAEALHRLAGHLPRRIALRDFHAENIIWRAGETGVAQVGLLDFQDAVSMPAGYDLVSLIRDVRRPMPDHFAQTLTAQFCDQTGLDADRFPAAAAAIGAQRNLRILGVFGRLISDLGKPSYRALLPTTWALLQKDLAHPDLAALRDYVLATFPAVPE